MTDVPAVADSALAHARSLLVAGQIGDATRAYQALVDANPQQLEALNALAVMAIRNGDLVQARARLQQALAVSADDLLTLNHYAQLQQAEGDLAGALTSYGRVLSLRPDLYASRLSFARALEDQGESTDAVAHYYRAIRDAQKAGRWLSDQSTPPGIRPQVKRAMSLVASRRRELMNELLARWTVKYSASELKRVSGCIEMQLGDGSYAPVDRRQQPTRFPFPDLPLSPYLDKRTIPQIAALEALTPVIRSELDAILGAATGREAVFADPALAAANLRSERGPASWDGHYFYRYGQRNAINAAACPQTAAAIDTLPLCRVQGYGPEVLFSTLGPGTHLLPHHGVTNARVVGHLPLIVPPDCALRVAGEEHRWVEGEAVLFDDTYSHEAWNRSDRVRVVLIFDLWHPDLSEAERLAVCDIFETLGGFGAAADLPFAA